MDSKFYTDGNSIFTLQSATVTLENVETGKTVTANLDGGVIEGFKPVELGAPTAVKQQPGQRKHRAGGKSKYTGVRPSGTGKFQGTVFYDSKLHYLGTFDTEEAAARAVDVERDKHGLSKVNFP